jgi:hypothetical protein
VEAAGIERASNACKSLVESDGVLTSRRFGLVASRGIGNVPEKTCTNLYQVALPAIGILTVWSSRSAERDRERFASACERPGAAARLRRADCGACNGANRIVRWRPETLRRGSSFKERMLFAGAPPTRFDATHLSREVSFYGRGDAASIVRG